MRLGLRAKFLLSFLVLSFIVVTSMIVVTHFLAFQGFQEISDQIGKARIDALVITLQEEYEKHGGWNYFREDSTYLKTLIDRQISHLAFDMPRPPLLLPREIPPFMHTLLDALTFGGDQESADRGADGDDSFSSHPPPPVDLVSLLTLFDNQHQPIAGASSTTDGLAVRKIVVDGNTVGYLGVSRPEPSHLAMFIRIVVDQSPALLTVGLFILVIATLAAFFLSRHLLAPIKQLTRGAHDFAHRDFETRIDVTSTDELGTLAQDFNSMAETLAKYEEMRKQWLSDISHELRTPLSILRGEIEALQDGIRQTNRETLSSLHAETLHISRIVNDLHELSLADSGALHLRKEPVSALEVLKEQLSLFKKTLTENGISITEDMGGTNGPLILGDRDRLAQLFANLFKNTLRHTDAPGFLKVGQRQNSTHISIYFEDSEPGVPEESLDRLFDRLYRVDTSRSRAQGGSGLGLAICKNIVESHGGTITASNGSLRGLRIAIVLPLIHT